MVPGGPSINAILRVKVVFNAFVKVQYSKNIKSVNDLDNWNLKWISILMVITLSFIQFTIFVNFLRNFSQFDHDLLYRQHLITTFAYRYKVKFKFRIPNVQRWFNLNDNNVITFRRSLNGREEGVMFWRVLRIW